jgi:hypothetical protein
MKSSCSPCSHATLQAVPYTFGFYLDLTSLSVLSWGSFPGAIEACALIQAAAIAWGIFDLESFSHFTIILREFRSEVLRLLS